MHARAARRERGRAARFDRALHRARRRVPDRHREDRLALGRRVHRRRRLEQTITTKTSSSPRARGLSYRRSPASMPLTT